MINHKAEICNLKLNESVSFTLAGADVRVTKKWGNMQDVPSVVACDLANLGDLKFSLTPSAVLVSMDTQSSFFGDREAAREKLSSKYFEIDVRHLVTPIGSKLMLPPIPIVDPAFEVYSASLFIEKKVFNAVDGFGSDIRKAAVFYGGMLWLWSGANGFHYEYEIAGKTHKTNDRLVGFEASSFDEDLIPGVAERLSHPDVNKMGSWMLGAQRFQNRK